KGATTVGILGLILDLILVAIILANAIPRIFGKDPFVNAWDGVTMCGALDLWCNCSRLDPIWSKNRKTLSIHSVSYYQANRNIGPIGSNSWHRSNHFDHDISEAGD
uniref:Uncharacterized protein n=1 Tax=Acrobeloides nanus TaxID=290746 RepID=A0A914D1J8_9BILA